MRFTYDKKEKRRTKILDNVQIALEIDVPHHQGMLLFCTWSIPPGLLRQIH